MESSFSRQEAEERRQVEIRRQIAKLQAELADPSAASQSSSSCGTGGSGDLNGSPKRKKMEGNLLVRRSPSPKKRKVDDRNTKAPSRASTSRTESRTTSQAQPPTRHNTYSSPTPSDSSIPPKPTPSTLLNKLSQLSGQSQKVDPAEVLERSTAFNARPAEIPADVPVKPTRGEDLTVIEDLEPGPVEHKPPFDDPLFERLEPNSGIHLSSRELPHEDLQEYLSGRYYLSPSKLYSVVRLLPNNQGYDVPVAGDFVTIGVVAERGPIKYSRAPVALNRSEDHDGNSDDEQPTDPNDKSKSTFKDKKKRQEEEGLRKPSGRKFVNLKLIDFGARSKGSATGGKSVIRGDAFLSLLLFESESYDVIEKDDGGKEKVYKGGSKGAFEAMAKLREGSVVALLNPRVLKPFQRSTDTPHPTTNILAVTPESASSIAIIGRARDLGMCTIQRRDGKVCGSWYDKRVSQVCEYHVQNAVQQRRAGRAEFAMGTSGMSATAVKRKPDYDPMRKYGLLPDPSKPSMTDGGDATYVVSGHVVSSGKVTSGMFMGEKVGREAQSKAQRQAKERATEKSLQKLLDRDREGMSVVRKAREVALKIREEKGNGKSEKKGGQKGKPAPKEKENGKTSSKRKSRDGEDAEDGLEHDTEQNRPQKSAYSAEIIRRLGFDPTLKPGERRQESDMSSQLRELAAKRASKEIDLGRRPGKRIRSVKAPSSITKATTIPQAKLVDLDDGDDEELEEQEKAVFGKVLNGDKKGMVSLDSDSDSDDDLVVVPPVPVDAA